VDESGAIRWANLIVATGHNNLAIGRSVEQVAKRFVHGNASRRVCSIVSAVERAFDPCLSCSTHAGGIAPMRIQLVDAEGGLLDELHS
jgi:NAD-reducing hydrogenase large subunit